MNKEIPQKLINLLQRENSSFFSTKLTRFLRFLCSFSDGSDVLDDVEALENTERFDERDEKTVSTKLLMTKETKLDDSRTDVDLAREDDVVEERNAT